MGYITSDGEKLRGEAITAAATNKFHFPLYDQSLRGLDIAAATTLVSAGPEEYFHVNGVAVMSFYDNTFLLDGKEIVLWFQSAEAGFGVTLRHNVAGGTGTQAKFILLDGGDTTVFPGDTIILRYESTGNQMVQIGGSVGTHTGGGGGGVASVTAGPGISITGTLTNPIVNNTGVLFITAGAGISITGTTANPIVSNTGVLSITAGTNISLGGTAQNPIINAAGGGGGGAAPTLFRRSNIAGMVGIDASAFLTSDAHICEVLSTGDFYKYTPSTTVPSTDGILAILNTGGGGGQWVRMGIFNPIFQQATYWAIDPSNSTGVADDENQGWGTSQAAADAVPLRTRAELNRRMVGVDEPTARFFHLLSSETILAGSDVLSNLRSRNGQGFPIFIGKKTQVGSDYTVTAYADAVPSANTGYLLSATGLGAGGNVGKLVTNSAETKFSFIKASLGANQVRIHQPDSWDAVSQTGGFAAPFIVGETVRVWDLPILRSYPFTDQVMFPGITACEVQGTVATHDFGAWQVGTSSPLISHSILNGIIAVNGVGSNGTIIGCLFSKNPSQFIGTNFIVFFCSGVLGTQLTMTACTLAFNQNFDLENSFLGIQNNSLFSAFGTASMSAFNVPNTGSMVTAYTGSKFLAKAGITPFYGSGNAAGILNATIGTTCSLDKAITTVSTSNANPITLAGVTYPLASLPIIDLSTASAINGGI